MLFSSPAQLWLRGLGQGQGQGRLTLQPDWLEVSRPAGRFAVGTEAQRRQEPCRAATSLRPAYTRKRGEDPSAFRLPATATALGHTRPWERECGHCQGVGRGGPSCLCASKVPMCP